MLEAHQAAGGKVDAFAAQIVRRLQPRLVADAKQQRAPTRSQGNRDRGRAIGSIRAVPTRMDGLKQLAALQAKLQKPPKRLAR